MKYHVLDRLDGFYTRQAPVVHAKSDLLRDYGKNYFGL